MKISYKREIKHNYLIIEPEEDVIGGFESRMLVGNHIEGLLRFRIRQLDSKTYYYYEITSRQPLGRLFEHKGMNLTEIRGLILSIASTLDRMEEFLLKEEQILLEAEYIYVDPDTFNAFFCLIPGSSFDFSGGLSRLLQYLLGKVDHQDKEAVVAAYGLFQESQKENYGIEDLLKVLNNAAQPCETARENAAVLDSESGGNVWSVKEPLIIEESDRQDTTVEKVFEGRNLYIIMYLVFVLGGPGFIWFLRGMDGLFRAAYWLVGVDIIAGAALAFVIYKKSWSSLKQQAEENAGLEWLLSFENEISDENDNEFLTKSTSNPTSNSSINPTPNPTFNPAAKPAVNPSAKPRVKPEAADAGPNTVLLRDFDEQPESRKLVSLDKQLSDIPIPYFPFIIGKQENIADYILDKGTVSRLHLRIDHLEGKYQFTDLNTTNGTRVEGHMLNANETVTTEPGSEVYIADIGYLFL